MQNLLLLILSILFGALWGTVQGMIMIQPKDKMAVTADPEMFNAGVRNHRWFAVYHLLCIVCTVAFAGAVLLGFSFIKQIPLQTFPQAYMSIVFLTGCFLLGWETSESMYSFSRYGEWIGQKETVHILDAYSISLTDGKTLRLHVARIVVGVFFVCWYAAWVSR